MASSRRLKRCADALRAPQNRILLAVGVILFTWRANPAGFKTVRSRWCQSINHNMIIREIRRLKNNVYQIEFAVEVNGDDVPCVLWTPGVSCENHPLIAMGHGGSQHKKAPGIRDRAIRYATRFGWTSLALDAPGHGERITPKEAAAARLKTQIRLQGDRTALSLSPEEKIIFLDRLAAQAVPEWRTALDATLAYLVPTVDRIGYWGVSQGTWIGIPLLAEDKRIACAVFGLAHLHPDHATLRHAAGRITVPIRFAVQWDDPIRSREYGIALFNAFGSSDKSMHINPGGHTEIPAAETESWDTFFQRHLR